MATVDVVYDPYDYAIDADPHPVWKRLRDEAPVYFNDRHDFYALSRFDDVLAAHLDPVRFSSAHTTVLEMMSAEPSEFEQSLMIFMDPPQHTRYRKLVARAFTPRHMAAVEVRVRELAAGFLDPFVDAGELDYVTDFGARLPVMVISALLGAPKEDEVQLREWSDEMLHIEPGEILGPRAMAVRDQVHDYWQAHIDERRKRPRDDIMSELMAAEFEEPDGSSRHLVDDELHAFYGLISAAGNETVAALPRLGGDRSRPISRRTPQARRRPVVDPERGRGDPALGSTVGHPGALDNRGHTAPRHRNPEELEGRAAHRRREP